MGNDNEHAMIMSQVAEFKVMKAGTPGGIRTPDHLVRSQVLYPTELRAQNALL